MKLNLKSDYTWSLLVATSMGVRLTPSRQRPVHTADMFHMYATSAETNVASVASSLGLPVKVLTNFVKDSPISRLIQCDLRQRGMDYEGVAHEQGGPWGLRHQMNIADSGFGGRGPRVQNDRAGEVGRLLSTEDFDLERIFADEGVAVVHLSGLIASLSPESGQFCLDIAEAAKKQGSLISFDLNHRESFWKGRQEELTEIFHRIASVSDILVGNEEDFQLCLGIQGPEAGGKGISGKIDGFKGMIQRVRSKYTNASVFATTLREVEHANSHLWGGILLAGEDWHVVEPRRIAVLDRIGGGDGFVGGLLYAILKGWDPQKWLHFGWASGALAATMETDFGQPADEAQVWSIWEGNARVQR